MAAKGSTPLLGLLLETEQLMSTIASCEAANNESSYKSHVAGDIGLIDLESQDRFESNRMFAQFDWALAVASGATSGRITLHHMLLPPLRVD
jgi:hypothetical protein